MNSHTLAWRLIRALPETLAYQLFNLGADLLWLRRTPAVTQLEANLARVPTVTDPRRMARAGLRSYARYWCDALRLPDWTPQRLAATVRNIGDEPVRAALTEGTAVIGFLGHLGNWDHAGAWSTQHLTPVTTVAERLQPEALFTQFRAYREQLGMRIIPLDTGSAVLRELLHTANHGGFIPLLADRDLTGAGATVQLFGQPTRAATGPAAIALKTGAQLYTLGIHYEQLPKTAPARHGIVLTWTHIPLHDLTPNRTDITTATQRCLNALATTINAHPQDWHMLQPIYTADHPDTP